MRCNCASSGFIDKDNRHIVTEDLRIVGNNKLGKLLTKDPEYRGTNNISREKVKSTIIKGLNDCIDTWCTKHGINKQCSWNGKAKLWKKLIKI